MINLNLSDSPISDVKYGSQQVEEVYHDSNLVWERDDWDGDYVYFRMGSTLGCTPARGCTPYTGDILLGGSDGLLYDTGSSNPNYNGLTSITKYEFTISTSATEMKAGYSLLNLFDGINDNSSYAYVKYHNLYTKAINFEVYMPFNQWELTQVGYWEGTFTDSHEFVNEINLMPPNRTDWVTLWSGTPSSNTFRSFPCSYSFNNGDSKKNRFELGLVGVVEQVWHYFTEITFELKIPYTEYKAWKRLYHVPVKIEKKTINNETIGTIIMKGNS